MADLFDEIWDIRTIGFIPKPEPSAYDAVVAAGRHRARQAAMFDDIARNLVAAARAGHDHGLAQYQSDWSRQGPDFPVARPRISTMKSGDLAVFLRQHRDLT